MSLAPPRNPGVRLEPSLPSPVRTRNRSGLLAEALRPRVGRWIPLALASGAGGLALLVSSVVFPLLSENNDEAIYLLQAEALRHGRLFPPAPENWRAFLPALSVWRDGHFVVKYAPVHAGIIAAADLVAGSQRAGLFLIASLATATSYLLARQVLTSRRKAVVASAFFAFSPLIIIQSGTFLSYLSALALLQGFAAALLVGVRRDSRGPLALSGLLLGIAVFARPYDALLFAAPLGMWVLWTNRGARRRLAHISVWIGLGAVPPLVAMLAFFQASTGNVFDSPFNLLHASDTVGFGRRQIYPQSRPTFYSPGLGRIGLTEHVKLLGAWSFGGIFLAGLAAAGFRKLDWHDPGRWLGLVALTVPVGYFFFWGSYGSIRWGAPFRLGPFYYMPVLTPLAILGAAGLDVVWWRSKRIHILILACMIALTCATLAGALRDNRPFTQARRDLYGPLMTQRFQHALVFLPRLTGSSLLTHPFALARNPADLSEDVLWALDRGHAANLEVMSEFPGRVPYLLTETRRPDRPARGKPWTGLKTELQTISP